LCHHDHRQQQLQLQQHQQCQQLQQPQKPTPFWDLPLTFETVFAFKGKRGYPAILTPSSITGSD
jgi:hypothetical protein